MMAGAATPGQGRGCPLAGSDHNEDFRLQIEHALDLEGTEAALFLDAGKGTPPPFVK
jgi:hypothetical protein